MPRAKQSRSPVMQSLTPNPKPYTPNPDSCHQQRALLTAGDSGAGVVCVRPPRSVTAGEHSYPTLFFVCVIIVSWQATTTCSQFKAETGSKRLTCSIKSVFASMNFKQYLPHLPPPSIARMHTLTQTSTRRQYKALHDAHLRSHGPAAPLRPLISFAQQSFPVPDEFDK